MHDIDILKLPYHPNPYPDYKRLRQHGSLFWHPSLALWIATDAYATEAVLNSSDCVVRPPQELVPKAIATSSAGEVFAKLIRMNEGPAHQTAKAAIMQALVNLDAEHLQTLLSQEEYFVSELGDISAWSTQELNQWMMSVPVRTMAMALGFDRGLSHNIAELIAKFVACLSPLSQAEQLAAASEAARTLLEHMRELMAASSQSPQGFVAAYLQAAQEHAWQDQVAWAANLLGLLSQTYEATAALLGNCLVHAKSLDADRRRELALSDTQRRRFVEDIARRDPAIQNTRRFVQTDCVLQWQAADRVMQVELRQGQAILLLLASANHSGADTQLGFSHARHRCPGQMQAISIVGEAMRFALTQFPHRLWEEMQLSYQPSMNARIPVFTVAKEMK